MQSLPLLLPIPLLHLTGKWSLILALMLMDKLDHRLDHRLDQQDNILMAVLLLKQQNIQALLLFHIHKGLDLLSQLVLVIQLVIKLPLYLLLDMELVLTQQNLLGQLHDQNNKLLLVL